MAPHAGPARAGATQAGLLDSGYRLLRPGGWLVYSVCSVEPEEGDAVVDAFLERSGAQPADPKGISAERRMSRARSTRGDGCARIRTGTEPTASSRRSSASRRLESGRMIRATSAIEELRGCFRRHDHTRIPSCGGRKARPGCSGARSGSFSSSPAWRSRPAPACTRSCSTRCAGTRRGPRSEPDDPGRGRSTTAAKMDLRVEVAGTRVEPRSPPVGSSSRTRPGSATRPGRVEGARQPRRGPARCAGPRGQPLRKAQLVLEQMGLRVGDTAYAPSLDSAVDVVLPAPRRQGAQPERGRRGPARLAKARERVYVMPCGSGRKGRGDAAGRGDPRRTTPRAPRKRPGPSSSSSRWRDRPCGSARA